jgi:hypothetical protein
MLPVRINLPLLIFVTLLLSCDTETKDDKVSSGKTIINTQDQLPKYPRVYVKPVPIKKENGKRLSCDGEILPFGDFVFN